MGTAATICDVLPPSLKLAQLQRVAFLCGLTTSGTKPVIRQRLIDVATATSAAVPTQPQQQQQRRRRKASPGAGNGSDNRRILSIDLGLRNLAWSLLTPAPAPAPSPARRRAAAAGTIGSSYNPCVPPPVHLHAWTRNSLVKAPSAEEEEEEQHGKTENEFSPARMAVTAVRFVRQTLLPLNPTHVLIERQRFRTGGAAPVQEWTLRVNTLEAMIHAAFRTLVECGHWDGEVVSVSPTHVGPFWLDGGEGDGGKSKSKGLKGAKAKLNMKKEKIDILGNWLEAGDVVLPQNESVEAMVDTFTQYWKRKPHARKLKMPKGSEGGEDEVIKKIDDLADSVLQGLAWIKWEENKANLHSTDGIMKLLDL